MSAHAPSSESGTVTLGMTVAQKVRRNTKITATTRPMVSSKVNCTSSTEARMVCVRSLRISTCSDGGIAAAGAAARALMRSTVSMTLAPGCLKTIEEHAALAGRPGGLLGVLRAGDGLADVAHAQRRAVAVGDDHVVPGVGDGELVVGVDGVAAHLAVDAALGRVDGRDRQLGAHVLQRQVLGHQLGRIELDADGRLLLAADA